MANNSVTRGHNLKP